MLRKEAAINASVSEHRLRRTAHAIIAGMDQRGEALRKSNSRRATSTCIRPAKNAPMIRK
jgi:hypothetical protein